VNGIDIDSKEYKERKDDQDDEDGALAETKVLLVREAKFKCKVFVLLFCSHLSANPIM
jgi:hypothetical protein